MASSALGKIQKLLEKYAEVVEEGRVSKYNEEMTKKDFILPLFDALGWKTADSREVTAEEKVSKKRVDYGFRINGIPKFFLEAKSFKEDLDNRKFIDQAINYAWHKGCTWAILTNFESLKIFNAEVKTEHPWLSQFRPTLHCNEFVAKLDELSLLSREGFEKDLLDKEAEKWGKKAKKIPIDKQLLDDFTHFRDILSKSITKLNESKNLSEEELDESVQRILDRLIFIRNCEDRELEPQILISNYREWESKGKGHLVRSLRETFVHFDKEYNSKVFATHLCDGLDIDNEVLHEVIEGLYHSYDFSIIDADVLGTIYEQYLSHILKKTEKRAKLTENHLHRKEQGIYYTPTYIVDYIVRNTLGELLKNKKMDVEKIRVLDPACGSGSFLIKAFDLLNEYYQKDKYYQQTELDLKTGIPFTTKVKILQNNIFGVDLDKQAVEIAQLNLLLKIAEKGHRLPLLEQNIKCGNSLIDDEKVAGDKAFIWNDNFKEIMGEGGFDIIIGNPPYGALFSNNEKDFIKIAYESATGRYDSYYYFIERSIRLLVDGGFLSFITPDTWLTNYQTKNLRNLILSACAVVRIVGLPQGVFAEANVDTCIIIVRKEPNYGIRRKNTLIVSILGKDAQLGNLLQNVFESEFKVTQSDWMDDRRCLFNIYQSHKLLVNKVKIGCIPLGEISEMSRGINPYDKYAGQTEEIIKKRIYHSPKKLTAEYKKELVGSDIGRYTTNVKSSLWIKYGPWLAAPRNPKFFTLPHLVVQRIRNPKLKMRLVSTYIDPVDEYYNNSGLTNIIVNEGYSIEYVLAILNSKLMNWYYRQFFRDVNIKPGDLRRLPVKKISRIEQKRFVGLVDKILSLNKRLSEIGDKMTDERARIEDGLKKTDSEIDELVYKIYGITDAEKEIVENSLK